MHDDTRFTILPFPQEYDGANTIRLRIVVLPRNQNPLRPAMHPPTDGVVPFAEAQWIFEAGLISGLAQYLGNFGLGAGDGDRTVIIAGGVGDAASQATVQVMNRFLNRLPTVTIREGHRVKVYLTSDLELPAYESAEAPRGRAR